MGALSNFSNRNNSQSIPTFLSIDVEPDGFQLSRGEKAEWLGYKSMFNFVKILRTELEKKSISPPVFGWYFRTDPQIAEVYGRPDYALTASPDYISELMIRGDYFGVHCHALRWCDEQNMWIHDFVDTQWIEACTQFSLDSFAHWAGSPALRFRFGSGFLTNRIVEILDQSGVRVDLTLEPVGHGGPAYSGIDITPVIGVHTDCRDAPRVPFHPNYNDFRIANGQHGRNLLMLPLSTRIVPPQKSLWSRIIHKVVYGSSGAWPEVKMFHPSVEQPGVKFWDQVEHQLESMSQPYLSLAIRTDAEDSRATVQVQKLFEVLPSHPIAQKLRFMDPLDAVHRFV